MSTKIQLQLKWLIPGGIFLILVLVVLSQSAKVISATLSPEVIVKNQPQEVMVTVVMKPGLFFAPYVRAVLVEPGKDFNIFTGQKTTLGWLSKQGKDNQGNYIYKGTYSINHAIAETVQIQLSNLLGMSFMPKPKNPDTSKGYFDPSVPLLRLAVSTRPFTIPPDPGEAGKLTLEGIDSNHNGLRDDIEREIFFAYPQSEKIRMAWWDEYSLQQERMLHAEDKEALRKIGYLILQKSSCKGDVYNKLPVIQSQTEYKATDDFLVMVWRNTSTRVQADNKAIANTGAINISPEENSKVICSFDPNSLPD